MTKAQDAPSAEKHPYKLKKFRDVRIDDYYWLNDYWLDGPRKQEVLDYLTAENDYASRVLSPTQKLQDELYHEFLGRIKQTDESVPYFKNGYWYVTKTEEGKEYPIIIRRKGKVDAKDEILLDVNQMADGFDYYQLGMYAISPDNKLMAYGVDTLSRRLYTIYFKDLTTGKVLKESISNTTGNLEWAQDSKTVFYGTKDTGTLRDDKIWRYQLGKKNSKTLIYEEKDETYEVSIEKTKSERFIQIVSESTLSSETRYIHSDKPFEAFKIFLPREKNHLYTVTDYGGNFYILTNWKANNFRLMKSEIDKSHAKKNWKEVIPNRENVLLDDVDIFSKYLVLTEESDANAHIRVIPWTQPQLEYYIPFNADAYVAGLGYNPEFNTDSIHIYYQSMITPSTQYLFDMNTKERTVLKKQDVLGGYDESQYETKRLWAKAQDGTLIPISVVYKKGFPKDGKQPLLLYGYGAYGITMDAGFSISRISLLDRGFAYAIAHVRGGEEMGRQWYEHGKMFEKINTFTDFIDCAQYLIDEGFTSPNHLYANGGSAGGLLMGAIVNMRPDLWHGVVSDVPFVDVLTTMLDVSIPLTTGEYDEWGNPNKKKSYFYIKSYSPYDNIKAQDYPNLMINTGLHDSQVQYFEPAKYVAKLRDLKTDNHILIMNCDMSAGHGGKSGRFQQLKEVAREFAFYLYLEGKIEK